MTAARRCAVLMLMLLTMACTGAAGGGDGGDSVDAAPSPAVASEPAVDRSQPAPSPTHAAPSELAASPAGLQPSEGFDTTTVTLSSGGQRIRMPVWVADEPHLRQRGLMERRSLPSNAGMLFVFEEPTEGGFWMKDTLIPLSIAFIDDDGRVVETLDMQPCKADPCQVYTPGSSYRYALEANLGFFDEHGVGSGWTLDTGDAVEASE